MRIHGQVATARIPTMITAVLCLILNTSMNAYAGGITLLARLVDSCAKIMKPSVTRRTILLSTICANALIGFAIPVAVEAIAPIRPSSTVAGTIAQK